MRVPSYPALSAVLLASAFTLACGDSDDTPSGEGSGSGGSGGSGGSNAGTGQGGTSATGGSSGVTVGGYHAAITYGGGCVITPSSSLSCWGDFADSDASVLGAAVAVAAGAVVNEAICALDDGGRARCWPPPRNGDPYDTPTERFSRIAIGNYACAIRADDRGLECWDFPMGTQVADDALAPPSGEFVEVAVGSDGACAIRATGELACWGSIPAPPNGSYEKIACGAQCCALDMQGRLACWRGGATAPSASGNFDELGVGEAGSGNALGIYGCGIRGDGSVECFGSAPPGASASTRAREIHVAGWTETNEGYACAVGTDNILLCWGEYPSAARTPPVGLMVK